MKKLVKSTLHHGYEANFLLTLMSGQGGPSFSCKWSWKPTSFTAYERLKVYLIFFPSKQSRCNAAPILLKPKLSSSASFFLSLLLSLHFLLLCCQEWFKLFHPFPFLLKLVTIIYFLPFSTLLLSGRCCHTAYFSEMLCNVCLYACVKMRKALEWFPHLTAWK